jgi:hypothetical protein
MAATIASQFANPWGSWHAQSKLRLHRLHSLPLFLVHKRMQKNWIRPHIQTIALLHPIRLRPKAVSGGIDWSVEPIASAGTCGTLVMRPKKQHRRKKLT